MRPEEQLLAEQLSTLGRLLRPAAGRGAARAGMWGGVAIWARDRGAFTLLHQGATSEGCHSHIEVQCLERLDRLVEEGKVAPDSQVYLYLNKAPCADYNGNRRNCLERVVRWARAHPARRLVVAFRKPCAVGALTERGSGSRPDAEVWPLYRMSLLCRELPPSLTLVSLFKERGGPWPQFFRCREGEVRRLAREQGGRLQGAAREGGAKLRALARSIDRDIQSKEKVIKKLELEFNKQVEGKNKATHLNNKDSDIQEFDNEKTFIRQFISEDKLKNSPNDMKKKRNKVKVKTLETAPIPIVAY
jgi:hypothetical protein